MYKNFLFITFLLFSFQGIGQENTRVGIHLSPTITWMKADDNSISSNGARVGIKVGGLLEYDLTNFMALSTGFRFAFSQGGTLRHRIGGNFFPDSDLTNPEWKEGDKPIPDDTDISYSLQVMEIPAGLKFFVNRDLETHIFLEAPILTLGIITRSRGAIDGGNINTSGENIGSDVRLFNLSWGFGGGIKHYLDTGSLWEAGIFYQSGFSDVTSNNGHKFSSGQRTGEDSRGTIHGIVFRAGIYF